MDPVDIFVLILAASLFFMALLPTIIEAFRK